MRWNEAQCSLKARKATVRSPLQAPDPMGFGACNTYAIYGRRPIVESQPTRDWRQDVKKEQS